MWLMPACRSMTLGSVADEYRRKEKRNEKSKRNLITDIFPSVKVRDRMFLKGCV